MPAPLYEYRPLHTVFASGAGDVWAASSSESFFDSPIIPTMLHFDGVAWSASADPLTVGINDLGGTGAGDVWAVGKAGKRLHHDGSAWSASF